MIKAQLLRLLKLLHPPEDPVVVVPDAVFFAEPVEEVAELPMVGAAQLVGAAVGADGALLQTGESPVELAVVKYESCMKLLRTLNAKN